MEWQNLLRWELRGVDEGLRIEVFQQPLKNPVLRRSADLVAFPPCGAARRQAHEREPAGGG